MARCFSGAAAATNRTARNSRTAALLKPATLPYLFVVVRLRFLLVERIDSQAAEKLGIEVGGFLRHDLGSESDVTHLRHAARIHQKSDVGMSICAPHLRQCLGSVPHIGEILLVVDGFFR